MQKGRRLCGCIDFLHIFAVDTLWAMSTKQISLWHGFEIREIRFDNSSIVAKREQESSCFE
jgi:hypothetical protein